MRTSSAIGLVNAGFSNAALAILALVAGACMEAPPVIESTTVLQSTMDTVGPYQVQAVVAGVTDQVVELRYRPGDGTRFIPLVMTADDSGERFRATIPGSPAGTRIAYYVAVLEDGARIAADPDGAAARPYTFDILPPDPPGAPLQAPPRGPAPD